MGTILNINLGIDFDIIPTQELLELKNKIFQIVQARDIENSNLISSSELEKYEELHDKIDYIVTQLDVLEAQLPDAENEEMLFRQRLLDKYNISTTAFFNLVEAYRRDKANDTRLH